MTCILCRKVELYMHMPLLKKSIEEKKGNQYDDIILLHINHCLDNSFYFNDMLHQLFPELIFVGVPYNHKTVKKAYPYACYYAKYEGEEYELMKNDQSLGDIRGDFLVATLALIEQALLRDIIPRFSEGKKLLIIEDGGYHYDIVGKLSEQYPKLTAHILGVVEQTTSGTKRCLFYEKHHGLQYPCISIARSDMKMNLESVFIGQRVVEELSHFLYTADLFLSFQHILLVGYGIIGRSIANVLNNKRCHIGVYDIDPEILDVAKEDGYQTYPTVTKDMFDTTTILIGSVGIPSFTEEMFLCFLQGKADTLYLASASSKNLEFIYFIEYLKGIQKPIPGLTFLEEETTRFYTAYHFSYQKQKKTVVLVAEGVPVNFYREDVISLTYSMIDIVFTEMFEMAMICCKEKTLPNQLLLLGRAKELVHTISEEELIKSWFEQNQFYYQQNLKQFLNVHPLAERLREKLI